MRHPKWLSLSVIGIVALTARLYRWDFLLTAEAVPVLGSTGFPLNPIATF